MNKGLDELDKEELFMWLSPKVGDEVAQAVLDNELSGAELLDLNDDELKEVAPKLGPRKALKKLIDDFKGVRAAQQKVRHKYFKIIYAYKRTPPVCTSKHLHIVVYRYVQSA